MKRALVTPGRVINGKFIPNLRRNPYYLGDEKTQHTGAPLSKLLTAEQYDRMEKQGKRKGKKLVRYYQRDYKRKAKNPWAPGSPQWEREQHNEGRETGKMIAKRKDVNTKTPEEWFNAYLRLYNRGSKFSEPFRDGDRHEKTEKVLHRRDVPVRELVVERAQWNNPTSGSNNTAPVIVGDKQAGYSYEYFDWLNWINRTQSFLVSIFGVQPAQFLGFKYPVVIKLKRNVLHVFHNAIMAPQIVTVNHPSVLRRALCPSVI